MNIGDLILRLLADGSQLEQDVTKEAQKAGDAGAKTMGARLSAGLKTNGLRAFSAVAGTVFAGMTKGALELEDVQARFQADTGASADEAAHAAKVINKAAGDNRLSLNEVADAAEKVHNDLGLVGDAADHATEKFAEYGRVTKQQAGAAVKDFDDILDAWNLTAADADGIMDKLIVSHQRYGGVVADDQKALAALAPALQAANLNVDDGIGLLGLFNAAGVDSAAAVTGMTKALGKVKSPEELQALIDDISNTEDPFLRAQKAADLFGAKAGPKLAQALAGANIKDFTVSVEDAAGATDKAAAALDSGFGNQFKKLMSQAGAAVRGFGADFGPALTGAAALGSLGNAVFPGFAAKIGSGLLGAIKKILPQAIVAGTTSGTAMGGAAAAAEVTTETTGVVAGQAAVGAAAEGPAAVAGTGIGAAMGAAVGIAAAAAIGAAIALGFKNVFLDPALQQQTRDIGTSIGNEIATGTSAALQQSKAALEKGIADITALPLGGFLYGDQLRDLQTQLDATNAEILKRAGGVGPAVGDALASGEGDVTSGAETMVGGVKPAVDGAAAGAKTAGAKIPDSVAAGVLAHQNEPVDAMNTLKDLMKNALTPSAQIARNIGILTSKELAHGLRDRRPAVRAEAKRVQAVAEASLAELIAGGGKVGKKAGAELARALRSKDPAVRAAAQRVKASVTQKLNEIPPKASQAGSKAGSSFIQSFKRGISAGGIVTIKVRTSDDTKGGRAVGGPVRKGEPWWVGELGPEIFVPKVDGTVLTASQSRSVQSGTAGTPLGGGGDTINLNMPVTGILRAETPADLVRPMRLLAASGAISNPRRRRRVEVPTRG